MKLSAVVFVIGFTGAQDATEAPATLQCWSCNVQWDNQMSNEEMWDACEANGSSIECIGEQTTCFTLERHSGQRQVMMVEMGCKQKAACLNNKYQNFWKGANCNRGADLDYRSSKCYDCCDANLADDCNFNWLASYKAAVNVNETTTQEFLESWKSKDGKF